MRIVLSGGGTAGHINPALALAETLEEQGHEVFYAGTPQGVEARLVKEAGLPFQSFRGERVRSRSSAHAAQSAAHHPEEHEARERVVRRDRT